MCDEYIPDDNDYKDWEELIQEQKQWNKSSFVIQYNGSTKTVERQVFIEYLRKYIVVNLPNYANLTRRELVDCLEQVFHIKEELRRFCDFSIKDFESMLDGASFPYLEHAWNSMFHPGLLEDMKPTKMLKQKMVETTMEQEINRKTLSSKSKKTKKDYSLGAVLKELSSATKLDRIQAKLINNSIRVLLFRQEITLRYRDTGIRLQQFIDICLESGIPAKSIDRVFGTGTVFANILFGITKGVAKQSELSGLFQDIFQVKLIF